MRSRNGIFKRLGNDVVLASCVSRIYKPAAIILTIIHSCILASADSLKSKSRVFGGVKREICKVPNGLRIPEIRMLYVKNIKATSHVSHPLYRMAILKLSMKNFEKFDATNLPWNRYLCNQCSAYYIIIDIFCLPCVHDLYYFFGSRPADIINISG